MSEGGWHRFDPATRTLTLTVHVQPGASGSAIAGRHGDALKVRIAAPALDNRANAALVDFLHRLLQTPARHIAVRHGLRGRRKIIEISGADAALVARLECLAGG